METVLSGAGNCTYISAMAQDDYLIRPDPLDPRLNEKVTGVDQTGQAIETRVTVERALTIFLNGQEIVTAMTSSPVSNTTESWRWSWCAPGARPITRRS